MSTSRREATDTVLWWSAIALLVAMATYSALAPSGIALAFAGLLGSVAVLLGLLRFAGESVKSLALAASVLAVLLIAHFVVGPGFL